MEWISECTQLQQTCVTGVCVLILRMPQVFAFWLDEKTNKQEQKNNHYPKTASLADSDSCSSLTQMSWSWTKKSTKKFN